MIFLSLDVLRLTHEVIILDVSRLLSINILIYWKILTIAYCIPFDSNPNANAHESHP